LTNSGSGKPDCETSAHDAQLLKGVLSLLLLQLLAERECYGYGVVQRLHEIGLADVLEGIVHPALARLEREGRVSTRLVSSNGPARKYYRPRQGRGQLVVAGQHRWLRAQSANPFKADQKNLTLTYPTQ
jgi:PadR family transcriptional regulator, regulatory protein PadR